MNTSGRAKAAKRQGQGVGNSLLAKLAKVYFMLLIIIIIVAVAAAAPTATAADFRPRVKVNFRTDF